MQKEDYSASRGGSNAFSEFRPWWCIRAQWEIMRLDFTRPPSRSSKDYPAPYLLKHLAMALCLNADREIGEVWISSGSLTRQLGYAPSTRRKVRRALKALENDFGVVELVQKEAAKTGRRYRICVGWADETARSSTSKELAPAPGKIAAIRSAYRQARLEVHSVSQVPFTRPEVFAAVASMVSVVSADTGETFDRVAEKTMRLFMEERGMDDGKLRTCFHPLDWIRPYLSSIERRMRKKHQRRRSAEAAPPPPEVPAVDATLTGASACLKAMGDA